MTNDTDDYGSRNEARHRADYLERAFSNKVLVGPAPLEENGRWFVVLPKDYDPDRDIMGRSVPGLATAADPPPRYFANESDVEYLFPYELTNGGDDGNSTGESLVEELETDRDNWASSEEDGWFYPDDEEGSDVESGSDYDDD